jgi:hypothetical protein
VNVRAQLDVFGLRVKNLPILPQRHQLFVFGAGRQHGSAQLEQPVNKQRGVLHVASEQKKNAGIDDIHNRAVRKVERRAEDPFDRAQAGQEFSEGRLERLPCSAALEARCASSATAASCGQSRGKRNRNSRRFASKSGLCSGSISS